ncbi:MAG TPA: chitobiase/beta-hexosaminidase C-terminal domain-containing protein, partial [Aeromicrobium sp.]
MAELEGSHNGEPEPEEKGTPRSRKIAIVVAAAIALVAAGLVAVQVAGGFDRQSSVPKPAFSKQHGFYSAPFSLELTAEDDRSIRYTTDGSTPTAQKGTEYSSPISIKGTTPVRAVAYDESGTSEVVAHTYIFLSQVRRQDNSPEGFPKTFAADDGYGPYPADYEMDPE